VEVYRLFLERHPEERARIDKVIAAQVKGGEALTRFVEEVREI